MSSIIEKKFGEELVPLLGKQVDITMSDGTTIKGVLLAVDSSLKVIMEVVNDNLKQKIILNSGAVKRITLLENPFDLKALSEKLNKLFPGLVKLREDIGAIIVMEKIKVTDAGVVEGYGPSAEKVRGVYQEYLNELKKRMT
jgi:small nuclear ribonucleoprotein (snRNP)-like protein